LIFWKVNAMWTENLIKNWFDFLRTVMMDANPWCCTFVDSFDRNPLMISALNGRTEVQPKPTDFLQFISKHFFCSITAASYSPRTCLIFIFSRNINFFFDMQAISLILDKKPPACSPKTLLHQQDINKVACSPVADIDSRTQC
jgi:hypothetical protein